MIAEPDLRGLSPDERAAWQTRMDWLKRRACGCTEGAAALMIALIGVLLALWLQPGGIVATGWREAGYGLAAIAGAAALGKWFGVLRVRVKLRRATAELKALMKARESRV